jgi:uncharacterized DUF497 family protein
MIFEWDSNKSSANLKKHGIDFETAKELWLDQNRIEITAPHPLEERNILIGKIKEKVWTAVFTMRGNAIRIISVRRSREKEVKLYEKEEIY